MQFRKTCLWLLPTVVLAVSLLAALCSYGVTVMTASAPQVRARTVVILDPGHGGEDGGAVSCTGVRESVLNLEISKRTEELLLFLGIPTEMTRRDDVSVADPAAGTLSERKASDLKNRVRMVNQTADPLLVSIHQNYFQEARYGGAQVFFADTPGSRELAEEMQSMLRASLEPSNHRAAKESRNVYLLNNIQCTGILVECGFLSNRREEALLRSEDYQKKLAVVIAGCLRQYLTGRCGPA